MEVNTPLSLLPRGSDLPLPKLAMPSTSNPSLNGQTNGRDAAALFSEQISGKYIVITGVNLLGIGFSTAEAFASQAPSTLVLCGRTIDKLQACSRELKLKYPSIRCKTLRLDLADQDDVREAAKQLLLWEDVPQVDLLVNNAGIMEIPERQFSPQGIELHLATNHIGHFLFTNLIMNKLIAAAKTASPFATRVVNVSSKGAAVSPIRFSDLNWNVKNSELPQEEQPAYEVLKAFQGLDGLRDQSYIPMGAYGQSKTANLLFGLELNARLRGYSILGVGLEPGGIVTEIVRYSDPEKAKAGIEELKKSGFVFKSLEQGSSTTIVAACDPKLADADEHEEDRSCIYLSDCQVGTPPDFAASPELAERLWKASEHLVDQDFSY